MQGMKIISGWRSSNYLARFGIFLIITALITGIPVSYSVAGDDNQPSQNLEIYTWYDLDAVRDNLSGDYILMNDLNSTPEGYTLLASTTANGGKGWEPIGYSTPGPAGCQASSPIHHGLSGALDGQGYEICDLFINNPDEFAVGLFAYLKEGGTIKNVGVVNFTVNGYNVVGSLVGLNEGGTVDNCYSTGNVAGHAAIGGLVGRLYGGNISNSYSTGNVSAKSSTGIGGLVGQQHPEGTISNSYTTCSVAGRRIGSGGIGSGDIGGLVGDNYYGDENVISSFWDKETSGLSTSDGGTGKNTTEMQDIATFSDAGWNIIVVVNTTMHDTSYIWNIVNNVTYPFLSWQS
jgi:hypothetical protein